MAKISEIEFSKIKEQLAQQKESKNEPTPKTDFGKVRFELIPGDALEELAKIYTYGALKYEANSWRKGSSFSRIFGAMQRHAWAFWRGEEIDEESGLYHIMQAAWNCFTLFIYSKTKPEFDDRIKDLIVEPDWPVKPGWYKHFKGGRYLVESIAIDSETGYPMVIYSDEKGNQWCRLMDMFLETIEVDDKQVPRFERIENGE